MSIGKYFKRGEPSPVQSTELAPVVSALGDVEKAHHASHVEGDHHGHQQPHVDPDIEKRVVRKMDRNIIPLVMSLCKISSNPLSRDRI
jgi:hypothetical protein